MAIKKKGFRKITIGENQFLWKVRKKVSWEEIHNGKLGIPIQHITGGQLLIVDIGFSRSLFDENNEFPITPSLIKKCIKKALKNDWNFNSIDKPLKLDCTDLL